MKLVVDEITVSTVPVSTVPLPASFPLLAGGVLLLGMVTRVTAPLLRTRDIHLGMAAASVLLALLIWAALFFTALTGTPDDGS